LLDFANIFADRNISRAKPQAIAAADSLIPITL
jgi:hypothetical protein